MARAATAAGLADFFAVVAGELKNGIERGWLKMRLVAKRDCPMTQRVLPSGPLRGALDGTEHAPVRAGIDDARIGRKPDPIQLTGNRRIVRRANHRSLRGPQLPPNRDEMPEDRVLAPGEKHFWPAHSRRTPGGEYDRSKFKLPGVGHGSYRATPPNGRLSKNDYLISFWWYGHTQSA